MQIRHVATFLRSMIVLLAVVSVSSCKVTRDFVEGESLLVKNKVILKDKLPVEEKDKVREDLSNIAAQKPNRKFLGFMPFKMWIYYTATRPNKRLTKFRRWMIEKVGEAPVLLDTSSTSRSVRAMENYLFNFGYFYADVQDTTVIRNKKSSVRYDVHTGSAWRIGDVKFIARNTSADSLIQQHMSHTVLKKGERFDIANLKNERVRIEDTLRNNGYFYFNREYITYDLDTGSKRQTVNIKISINPPSDTSQHLSYKINNIFLITDYVSDISKDTTKRDTTSLNEYRFIAQQSRMRDNVLLDAVYLSGNKLYAKENELKTINRLSQLGIYKFININFERNRTVNGNNLDAFIYLTPAKRQSVSASGEINVTNEGFLGMASTLSYKNKNLSKRADQFLFDIGAGVQLRLARKEKVKVISGNINVSLTYYLNRFVPFRKRIFAQFTQPRTRLNTSYIFEHRFDFNNQGDVVFLYQLHNLSFNYGYEWTGNRFMRHVLNPMTLSFYLIPERGVEFNRRLSLNQALASSFEEQVILGPNYSFIYNNQEGDKDRVYTYFKTALETSGNILYAGFKLANLKSSNDQFLILKRPFSQYFRIEADWRNYVRIRNHGMFAIRTFAGIGIPYGNSDALPFVKQFFVGGPNSLRGFLIREIGPGSYVDTLVYNPETGEESGNVGFFNQTGDIKLEINAELRFDIYKWLKGAVFVDAGNVWTIKKDTRTNGNFEINRFWKEFAVNAGVGARLDFNFFVIRLDYGFPFRDPRKVSGNRWLFENAQFRKGQFQLAIGYPF